MQRIIPFGRDYAQSAEFSVDEGQTIRFWLVREDYTTTPGEHAFAELQIKSASGNDHWTTLHVMDGDKPYYDLIGVDENVIYRWVRKPNRPVIAVDRANDGAFSRQLRAPVDPRFEGFDDPLRPLVFKAQSGAGPGDTTGFLDQLVPATDPGEFGAILGTPPAMFLGGPDASAYISLIYDPAGPSAEIVFHADDGDGNSVTDWSDYLDTGSAVQLYTECGDAINPVGQFGQYIFSDTGTPALDATATATTLTVPLQFDGNGNLNGFDPAMFFSEGKTFFVGLVKNPGQNPMSIDLGPRTGRFMIDRNDAPARLSAGPFDTDNEAVRLSIVEGNVVIPWLEGGDQLQLDRVDYSARTIEAPGEYEWERSCNSAPGIYLNTGWRA